MNSTTEIAAANHMRPYHRIRLDVIESLQRYATKGIMPGGFLTAVLENNLMEAIGRADTENLSNLHAICTYVYNEMPSSCHGSPAKVDAYLKALAERE